MDFRKLRHRIGRFSRRCYEISGTEYAEKFAAEQGGNVADDVEF